jgi:protein-S-isoprenylcysteine O-methyltransferase Ste14
MLLRVTVQVVAWLALMGVLLFAAAGNWLWPEAWAFLIIFALASIAFCAWLLRRDPALLEQRMGSMVQKGQPLWDKIFMSLIMVGWNVWLVFMGLDAQRFQWSHMPLWLEVFGALLILAGFVGVVPVFAANSFAAPVVRVQGERGQHVIDTGPYAWVRHPMYAAASLYLIGLPLLLGSWYGLIGAAIIIIGIAWRATHEEQTLKRDLSGYDAYMTRVPWRLIPHVW